jgi:signal transduction histidine kinase
MVTGTLVRMGERWKALVAGVELYGLALLGLLTFMGVIAAFAPGFGLGMVFLLPAPIIFSRRVTDLARRRVERRTGIVIRRPYRPAPPPPTPQVDGWYRRENQLYRTAWWPRVADRLDWVLGDNATWRDLSWMLLAPVTGGLLGLLPALLAVGGLSAPLWSTLPRDLAPNALPRDLAPNALPLPAALAAGLAVAAIGLAIAPWTLRGSARFHRRMLGGPLLRADVDDLQEHHPVREWVARNVAAALKLAVLLLTSLLAIPIFVATVIGIGLGYGLGMFFLVPMVLEDLRWLADWRRSLARWSGDAIASPYRPLPPLNRRPEDGMYQVRKNLYRTERWAIFARRGDWLIRDPATWREVLWRGVDPLVGGVIAGVPVLMVGYGVWGLALPRVTQTLFGAPFGDWYGHVAGLAWPAIPAGLLLAWLGVRLAPYALRLHGRWSRLLLGPTRDIALAQRVEQLTQTRADATEASASELRRIERDLHDGAQARLVAVGMSLAAIERLLDTDPAAARELLGRARESAATALRELREVVRGIHPPVLAERGLGDAVRALALDSPLRATVTVSLPGRLPDPIEAAAYFAVAEALGNAARHARAETVDIRLEQAGDLLRIVVRDDGRGGADPARGSGLRGLARRLGIFDGIVTIASPPGGPTELTMEIPCVSSSPRTSTS